MKLSVVIPAYNVEKYIERSIKSVCNQTIKDIEVIVVNDGSTDKTKFIVEKLKKNDSRIILINKKNGGLSSARNAGIEIARGEFICHLDGDDWIEKSAYEKMIDLAEKENLDIVVSDYYDDFDNGKKIKHSDIKFETNIFSSEDYLRGYFLGKGVPAIWNKIYRAELYKKNSIKHPENLSIGEDAATLPKLILHSKKIGKINENYIHYIQNPNSMTRSNIALKFDDLINVFLDIEKYFINRKEYYKYENEILQNKLIHFSNFIFYPSDWKNKTYLNNVDYLLNFFSNKEIYINLYVLGIFRRNYYKIQYYLKSKKLMYIVNKSILFLKKIKN